MVNPSINEREPKLDRLQLVALAALMCLGTLFVYSATMANVSVSALPWYDQVWPRQIVWYGLGIGAGVALCLVDYHVLARWSFVAYWATILSLVAVLVPHIGTTHGWGARRWIDLGPFQFQPSEFAKLAFILAAAHFLSRPPDELRQPAVFWKGIGLLLLPFVLILKEPDLGSALVLLPTGLVMMFVAGTPKRYLLKLMGGVAILVGLLLADILYAPPGWQIKMQDYQRQRLQVYFGTDFAAANAAPKEKAEARRLQFEKSYQVRQALIAVGSGVVGQGLAQGRPDRAGFFAAGCGAQ